MRVFRFVDRFQWLLLVIAAPFFLFPSPARSLVLLVIPLMIVISWLGQREVWPRTPLNVSLLLLAVMVLVSLGSTYDLKVSLSAVLRVMLGFAVFFTAARTARRPGGLWWVTGALILAAPAIASIGLLGTQWAEGKFAALEAITSLFPARLTGLASAGSGFNPNVVASSLLFVLPLLVVLSFYLLRRAVKGSLGGAPLDHLHPFLLWVLVLLVGLLTLFVLGVFILAQSRAASIALVLTLAGLVWLQVPARWKTPLLVVGVVGMLGLAAYLRSPGALAPKDLLVSSGVPVVETPSLESMESRLDLWSRAVYAIQDFPLTGMGMDVFQQVVHRLYPLYLIQITTTPAHAHNQYLQIAIDLGLPGLVAFLALNIGAFVMLARLARLAKLAKLAKLARLARQSREEGNTHLVLVYGLGGGLAASLLHGFLDAAAMVSKAWFLFWLVLGLVAGLYARQVVKGSPAGSTDTSQTPQSQ